LATQTEETAAKAAPQGQSVMSLILALVLLTGLGAGAGWLLALQIEPKLARPAEQKAKETADPKNKPPSLEGAILRTLPPIVTNLAGPQSAWIRLVASIIVDGESNDTSALAGRVADDILAFLRTVPLAHIQGASGLQHLREDLNERARIRSGGKVKELVVQSLMLE